MTVLVYETCECGTQVPRRISQYAIETVWCPACRKEQPHRLDIPCSLCGQRLRDHDPKEAKACREKWEAMYQRKGDTT